jgi:cholesterol transport system auxiliary component
VSNEHDRNRLAGNAHAATRDGSNDAHRPRSEAPRDASRAARRAALRALPAAAALISGCGSLVRDVPSPTWYVLRDEAADASPAAGAKIDKVLLISQVEASAFQGSGMLVYSRSPDSRAHYQFAGWTEPPARRIGRLVERRLETRGRLRAVAQSTSGVRGDMLLNLSLETLHHDVSTSPGRARVAIVAELVAWRANTLVARRRFEKDVPVEREAADAAVASINRALTALLDDLCPWVEAGAAG